MKYYSHLLFFLFIIPTLSCESHSDPSTLNSPIVSEDKCPFKNLEWMKVTEVYSKEDQRKVAGGLGALAEIGAKILKFGKLNVEADVSAEIQKEIEKYAKQEYEVSQEFFEFYRSKSEAMCNLYKLLKDEGIDPFLKEGIYEDLLEISKERYNHDISRVSSDSTKIKTPEVSIEFKTIESDDGIVWMAENLNYDVEGSLCYNCKEFGRLYNWSTANDFCQKLGWRLPTHEEWKNLIRSLMGELDLYPNHGSGKKSYRELREGGGTKFNAKIAGIARYIYDKKNPDKPPYLNHWREEQNYGYGRFWTNTLATGKEKNISYYLSYIFNAEDKWLGVGATESDFFHSCRCVTEKVNLPIQRRN